jgi:hypothetical protein
MREEHDDEEEIVAVRRSMRTDARVQPRRAKFASSTLLSWSARQRTGTSLDPMVGETRQLWSFG